MVNFQNTTFVPDIFQYFIENERTVERNVGKVTFLKGKSAAQSFLKNTNGTHKSLKEVINSQLTTDDAKIISFLISKQLLMSNSQSDCDLISQDNLKNKDAIIRLLNYELDKLLINMDSSTFQSLGLQAFSNYFKSQHATTKAPLSKLMEGLNEVDGNLSEMLVALKKFQQENPKILNASRNNLGDPFNLIKSASTALSNRSQANVVTSQKQNLMTHTHTLNSLQNLLYLANEVKYELADLKDELPISLNVAEDLFIQELARMSIAEKYQGNNLNDMIKKLRCTDEKSKIKILNRIHSIVSSLDSSFFKATGGQKKILEIIRELMHKNVAAEGRITDFVKNRL